jgi:hypothetical protein
MEMAARWARVGWLICMIILLPAAVLGLGVVVRHPEIVSAPTLLELFDRVGLSPVPGAWVGFVLPTALSFIVAGLIRRGRRDDPAALLFGLSLVSLYLILAGVGEALSTVAPRPLVLGVQSLAGVVMIFGLFLFPNGRFVPRWTVWPAVGFALLTLAVPDMIGAIRAAGTGTSAGYLPWVRTLGTAALSLALAVWLPAQVYRYRRKSTPLERYQTRWVLFGFSVVLIGSLTPVLLRAWGSPPEWAAGALLTAALGSLFLPVAAGLAILRYRLYEIDRVISRTLSYAIVVVVLAIAYAVGVFALSTLLPATGDLAVAASTLAVAALFNPLRHRILEKVERRFNRHRYNAERLVFGFAGRLRSQSELAEIISDLGTLIARTVEPTTASVWVREIRR